jgi:hypothetical protein
MINKKAFALIGVIPAIQRKIAAEKLIVTMACGLEFSEHYEEHFARFYRQQVLL